MQPRFLFELKESSSKILAHQNTLRFRKPLLDYARTHLLQTFTHPRLNRDTARQDGTRDTTGQSAPRNSFLLSFCSSRFLSARTQAHAVPLHTLHHVPHANSASLLRSPDFHTPTLESHPRLNQGSNCAAQSFVRAQREQFKKSGAPKHTALSETC